MLRLETLLPSPYYETGTCGRATCWNKGDRYYGRLVDTVTGNVYLSVFHLCSLHRTRLELALAELPSESDGGVARV